MHHQNVLYLAVLPSYREKCVRELLRIMPGSVKMFASQAHLEKSVRTGISPELFQMVGMTRLGNQAFVQFGHLAEALRAENLIVDLNPRSLTAWFLLMIRKFSNRRTLVWGHLTPKGGAAAKTAKLRKFMRSLADGTISYTYSDKNDALIQLPGQDVWVAPNSLYNRAQIEEAESLTGERDSYIYVGRLEPEKKPHLLVEALRFLPKQITLKIAGTGSSEVQVRELATDYGIQDRVEFLGWVDGPEELKSIYSGAFCSVSPGFAGLGLTQSLGFGVPQVIARDEQHSPEIELSELGGVNWFESNDAEDLSRVLLQQWKDRTELPMRALTTRIRDTYSAEAMAQGIKAALMNEKQ